MVERLHLGERGGGGEKVRQMKGLEVLAML